ncbi:hypothetical protein MFLAVUS_002727 [Mucor flavus]|uniref:Uncharacterized protein n=1 Tax=Mucor flavus TaxID=439312 RepID=A0ABP9YR28_9FUNG
MPPPPLIYPRAEELIRNKKQAKLNEQTGEEANRGGPSSGRRAAERKRKDTSEEERAKGDAKRRRKQENASSSSTSGPICKSCGQQGHSSAVSRMCPNHQFTLKERLTMAFPESYERFTISLPLQSFLKFDEEEEGERLEQYQQRITELSSFLRQVIYRAQILINYYILSNSINMDNLSNNIFDRNFWYRVCRLIYQNITVYELQRMYPTLPGIEAAFNHLQSLENVNLLVEKGNLVGYGQIVSSACETVATAYSNFYVENFENYIGNYFIYKLKVEYDGRDAITLNVDDFMQEGINQHFRPCTLDPGRRDAFVAYYGNNEVRSLSTAEYYHGSGSVNRSRREIGLKAQLGIQTLETNIPTPKTSNIDQYI